PPLKTTVDHPQLHSIPTRRSSDLQRHPEDDPAHPGHDPAAAARRRRKGAAARWARAAALAGAAALLAYAAGSGQVGTVDLAGALDRQSTRLNSSHVSSSYAGLCLT